MATIVVRINCDRSTAQNIARTLDETLQDFNEQVKIAVSDIPGEPDRQLILLTTDRPYTDDTAEDIFSVPGYDGVMRLPGVHQATVVSSDNSPK